ncbi:hypothetical protein [Amycolatopsis taiwanensis]|uniref:hypothetical protein n=1 Tax=Amycolatopsis taiwanensis TaxID=342230 RepID=UPI0004AF96FC|nr:hypothetical protein [Amycolatopsis taiwanensis]
MVDPRGIADAVFGAEELVGLRAHAGKVDVRQRPVPGHQFFSRKLALIRLVKIVPIW